MITGRRALGTLLAAGITIAVPACRTTEPPGYCTSDEQCRDPGRAGHDKGKPECHGSGHFCYEGCASDNDCKNQSKEWFVAGRTRCAPTRDCVSSGDGGGADLPMNLAPGAVCQAKEQCTSGLCVGRCCTKACDGACMRCGEQGQCEPVPSSDPDPLGRCGKDPSCASCDGQGSCAFIPAGTSCGSPFCKDGFVYDRACDGQGTCVPGAGKGCGGFACAADEKACKSSCAPGQPDCMTGFECIGATCLGNQENGKSCYSSNTACKSGYCVGDGDISGNTVCCDKACTGDCETCGLAGKLGTCTPVPAGQDPRARCKGDAKCGDGSCNGSGACAFPKAGKECDSTCDPSTRKQTLSVCSDEHKCTAKPATDCPAYTLCNGTSTCFAGCSKTHVECVSDSVCDRSNAHLTGSGTCVDPAKVKKVSSGTLGSAIAALTATQTHLRVSGGPYNERVTIDGGKKLTIIGDGLPTITPPSSPGDKPAFLVTGAGTVVTLQGLKLRSNTGGINATGVTCSNVAGTRSTLVVLESEITKNEGPGVNASYCDATLHRNRILSNAGGGVSLVNGTFVVVDNVVALNGTAAASFGGFNLAPGAGGSVSFWNNTVADNVAGAGAPDGVLCTAVPATTLINSILWNKKPSTMQQSGCQVQTSDVEGMPGAVDPSLGPDYKPGANVFNLGTPVPATITVIDIDGAPRASTAPATAGKVDLGAFQVTP